MIEHPESSYPAVWGWVDPSLVLRERIAIGRPDFPEAQHLAGERGEACV